MSARDQRWLDCLDQVRAYIAHHKRPPLSSQKPLGEWLTSQRALYRSGKMRSDRAELLAAEEWWNPGRQRSIDVSADKLLPDYTPATPATFGAEFLASTSATNLRETWAPNRSGVPACIWCAMPAWHCVIKSPCEGRKQFELRTTCHCNTPPS